VAAALALVFSPALAGAVQAPASTDVEAPAVEGPTFQVDPLRSIGPLAGGTMGVEFGAGGLGELWHLNGSREWLAGGSAGVWWSYRDGYALIVQFHATQVFQREPRHAFVNGFVPSLRWRLAQLPRMDVFAELGLGVTWSDTRVPPRGTRFNYLAETAFGVMRRVGRQTHAVVGLRLRHLSNNDREGPGRNPDIEAIGGYAALAVGF
jgi:hypothetical protein